MERTRFVRGKGERGRQGWRGQGKGKGKADKGGEDKVVRREGEDEVDKGGEDKVCETCATLWKWYTIL